MLISENHGTNIKDLLWMISTILIIGIATEEKFQAGLQQAIKKDKKNIKGIIIFNPNFQLQYGKNLIFHVINLHLIPFHILI